MSFGIQIETKKGNTWESTSFKTFLSTFRIHHSYGSIQKIELGEIPWKQWIFYIREFFLGKGFEGGFLRWSISSHIRVQITSESVRLIALIGLNMFSTQNVSEKSSKNILQTTFWRSVLKKWLKLPYSALGKGFSKVLCIKPKSSHLPLWWMWPSFCHISQSFLCSELWNSLPFQESLQRQV